MLNLKKIEKALQIANNFCGTFTPEDCPDSIAVPIIDALKDVTKELNSKFDVLDVKDIVGQIRTPVQGTNNFNLSFDYAAILIQQYAESYHAEKCKDCFAAVPAVQCVHCNRQCPDDCPLDKPLQEAPK